MLPPSVAGAAGFSSGPDWKPPDGLTNRPPVTAAPAATAVMWSASS
jgi:hypothetical protein